MKRGDVVVSLAGHDKGRIYVVLEEKDGVIYLTDGKRHTLDKPKKKKRKHLKETVFYADLSVYDPLYDAHILKEIKGLLKKGGCCLG